LIHMPRKGFRSITVREEIYAKLMQQYDEDREELLKQGITSFSGYVTRFLYDALERGSR
jgi:predicted CopG family antitoxin